MGTISRQPDNHQSNRGVQNTVIPKRFPVSAADHFMYLTRVVSDLTLRDILQFAGRLNEERLSRAIRLTMDAEPVMGCRFCQRFAGVYWERLPDLDSRVLCPIVEKQDFEAEMENFLNTSLDPTVGPQVEICLFRSDRDTLAIKTNHVVADGAGHMDYLTLLAKTYRELSANANYYPQPNLGANRGMGPVIRNVGPRAIIRGFRQIPRQYNDISVFPAIRQDFTKKMLKDRRITWEQFSRMKEYSRQHQVTIGDILLTAVYRALSKMLSPDSAIHPPIQITVSLRRYLTPGQAETIRNLSSVFTPHVIVYPHEPFGDTLARVHKMMLEAKEDQPWLGGIMYLGLAYLFRFPLARNIIRGFMRRRLLDNRFKGIVFSNMGLIEAERFSFGDVPLQKFTTFGQVHYPPGPLLSVNMLGNDMFFNMQYYGSAVDTSMVDRFLEMVVDELPQG